MRPRWRRPSVFLCLFSLAVLVYPRIGVGQRREGQLGDAPPNSVQIVVDGQLRKSWTTNELMGGRFDWLSPKGKFNPAVPLAYALVFKGAGFTPDSITELRIIGKKDRVQLSGEAVALLLKELILLSDIDKGGTWKLAARTPEAENDLKRLASHPRVAVENVRRIEVVTAARAKPKTQAKGRIHEPTE